MLFEPSAIVLYVDNLAKASQFYRDVLEINPVEASLSFHVFQLSNGMQLALKTKDTVVPPPDEKQGNGELAFTVENHKKVDALYTEWQAKGMPIILHPTALPFGYAFVALDPDGNRLRVVCLEKPNH